MLGHLLKVRRTVRAIRARDSLLDKRALVRAYVKTQLKYLFLVRLLRLPLRRERVLGMRIRFFDYATFAFMFEETFANEQYLFSPRNDAPMVLDGGANVGLATLYVKAAFPGARVVAFEPESGAAALLRRNVERNGLTEVQVVEAALTAGGETANLYTDRPGSVLATTKAGVFAGGKPVRAVRLSDYVDDEIDLLKLDVEGDEAAVLEELTGAGKLSNVRELVFEHNHHYPDTGTDSFSTVLALLERHGFGYQLSAPTSPPLQRERQQNILVYAYRKK